MKAVPAIYLLDDGEATGDVSWFCSCRCLAAYVDAGSTHGLPWKAGYDAAYDPTNQCEQCGELLIPVDKRTMTVRLLRSRFADVGDARNFYPKGITGTVLGVLEEGYLWVSWRFAVRTEDSAQGDHTTLVMVDLEDDDVPIADVEFVDLKGD